MARFLPFPFSVTTGKDATADCPIKRSLEGYSSWGHKESDVTEQLTHATPHTFYTTLLIGHLHEVFKVSIGCI